MNKPSYGKEKLLKVFEEIGSHLAKPLTVFMFGGGAMVFRDQKQGTKDLDVAFLNSVEFKEFASAVEESGFHKVKFLEKPYQEMAASSIWEKEDNFRIDVFVKVVCNALEVKQTVVNRSELLKKFGNLTVRMFSNEDLVLFKGITERQADVDDVATIAKTVKIDWNIILQECILQSEKRPWHGALLDKLHEIHEKHKVISPIVKELQNLYERSLLLQFYKDKLEDGKSHKEILRELKVRGFTEKEIKQLEKDLKRKE